MPAFPKMSRIWLATAAVISAGVLAFVSLGPQFLSSSSDELETELVTEPSGSGDVGDSVGGGVEGSKAERSIALTPVSIPQRAAQETVVGNLVRKQAPLADDWDTETWSEQINLQLQVIAKWITEEQPTSQELSALLSPAFRCTTLRPRELELSFKDQQLQVKRWKKSSETQVLPTRLGVAALKAELRQLTSALRSRDGRRAKFKLFEIEETKDGIQTRLYVEASSHSQSESVQQVSTWLCLWERVSTQAADLRLSRISLEAFEEAVSSARPHLFADCTASVLGSNVAYTEQVLPGLSHWLGRVGRELMTQFGHHGIAIGDINGDDLDDIYVCDAGGLPNRLYVQQEDGSALDRSAESGLDILEDSVGALLIDLDNDGDQDLVVATDPLVHFAENDGQGKFKFHRGYYANTDSYSLAAADYDQDGDTDVYVCGYNARKQDPVNRGLPFPLPYHDANNGGRNYLLRNDGQFRFVDATKETGLDEHNTRFSLAAAWEDFDNDGDQDLYVANDFGRNCLYENVDGRFTDRAAALGVQDHASGMSVAWGDPNRDGQMDVYVSNMFSAAGHRVTYQRRFSEGIGEQELSLLQRMARGNTLFSQSPEGRFEDVSEVAAVTMGRWAWGSRFDDLNNDGWDDLLVANGYVTGDAKDDL